MGASSLSVLRKHLCCVLTGSSAFLRVHVFLHLQRVCEMQRCVVILMKVLSEFEECPCCHFDESVFCICRLLGPLGHRNPFITEKTFLCYVQ